MKLQLEAQLASALAASEEAAGKAAAMAGFEQSLREARQNEVEIRRHTAAVEEELAIARRELESLHRKLEQADELRKRLALVEDELATTRGKMSEDLDLKSRAEATEGQLAVIVAELTSAREQLAASAAEIELLKQKQFQTEKLHQQAESASGELASMRQELETFHQRQGREDELQQQLAELQAELIAARGVIEQLENASVAATPVADQSRDEQLTRLAGEKAAVEVEYVRLATESREKEVEFAERLLRAEAEITRLTSELEIQGQVAAMEQAALRAELRRLIVEGGAAMYVPAAESYPMAPLQQPGATSTNAVAARPTAAVPVQPPISAAELQPGESISDTEAEYEDEGPDTPIVSDLSLLQEFTSEFGGFYGGSGVSNTEFRIDPSLDTIRYGDPADIIAVFYSSNSVQAVPDGKGIQRCKGYIVAIKTSGSYRVYVAWYLTESGRVVVCLPEIQPADGEECVLIIKDAVCYFEIVGFMMEIADLGSTHRSRRKALKKIPVLSHTPAGS